MSERIARLGESAQAFARLAPGKKSKLLFEVRQRFFDLAEEQVTLGSRAKGIDPGDPLAGEEWFSGPAIALRAIRLFATSLDEVERYGAPRIVPGRVEPLSGGRTSVKLLPHDAQDRALYLGWSCEAWLASEISPERIGESQAEFYRRHDPEGTVTLVLGAGNVGSISVLDVLHHSFVRGAVCLLKMSPVNAYLGPLFERAFAPLVERGFLAFAYGGADVGAHLVQHPGVDAVHVTGSVQTHDRIVWGPAGPERDARLREGRPVLDKAITSELGNIGPVMVVPARYSERELDAIAKSTVGMLVHNAGYNCNAARLLVTARDWPQREALLERVALLFRRIPPRVPFYPGARERYREIVAGADRVQQLGDASETELPWALVSDLDPEGGSPLFQKEAFLGLLAETALPTKDPVEFLDQASRFVNRRVWGTLNALFFVNQQTERDPALEGALSRAVSALRYGTVSINLWPAVGYGLGLPAWGGYPDGTLEHPGSGLGWGHNAILLEGVQKVVLRGPLLATPEPFWYPGRQHLAELGRALTRVEAFPSALGVARAAWLFVRG